MTFKTITDGETYVVFFKGGNMGRWTYCAATTSQEAADLYIAKEYRKDAQKTLYSALLRMENASQQYTTREMIGWCDEYITTLLTEEQARAALGVSAEEAA